jgi:hypothetical protein
MRDPLANVMLLFGVYVCFGLIGLMLRWMDGMLYDNTMLYR